MKHLLRIFLVALIGLGSVVSAADLSITTTSFVPGARAKKDIGTAGASITIGQMLYFDSTAGTWKLADADASATTAAVAAGAVLAIAGSGASSGQPVIYITEDDDLTLGATLSMSVPVYVLSSTAGGIAPSADISAGEYPCVLLVAKSTTKCVFRPQGLRGTAVAVAP